MSRQKYTKKRRRRTRRRAVLRRRRRRKRYLRKSRRGGTRPKVRWSARDRRRKDLFSVVNKAEAHQKAVLNAPLPSRSNKRYPASSKSPPPAQKIDWDERKATKFLNESAARARKSARKTLKKLAEEEKKSASKKSTPSKSPRRKSLRRSGNSLRRSKSSSDFTF